MAIQSEKKDTQKPFCEVVLSTNEFIIAECYKESFSPQNQRISLVQGAVVKVKSSYDNSYIAYGLISKINNTSLDTVHKPTAFGMTPQELEELQPQLYDLLKKQIEIYLFAYQDNGGEIMPYPPLKPMMIHDFVYETSKEEILKLTEDFTSLINIIKKNQLKLDILIDLITQGFKLRNNNYNYLITIGQVLSLNFSEEMDNLMQVLKRLSKIKDQS